MKKNKFILPSLLLFIGGLIFYFLKYENVEDNNEEQKNNNENENLENVEVDKSSGKIIIDGVKYTADKIKKVGYISERKDKNELVVHLAIPRPNFDYIKKGNQIMLVNMGRYNGYYNVNDTWKDDSGNLGAIYLTSNKIEKSNENNTEFENKGIIIKII